ncbi:MAG: Zn-dependent hydrolase [Rhodobacteraceae bacterium]|jgi:L-ascorbate metabolism protein UlaG (beta-lactamase superfamily)|uniref:Putative Zn-dependent hydrolase of beta-lactamase fold n=1 Tax=Salipiger profundus TaxID=1229727 RepID=A0A1U7D136_9RHOB|nr:MULTISPECIES: MBL fold metallo-hydrolase [Salipiger]APX21859.1 putative Zn-dependent hydrolase of beta-lactamase fold [Salipiger profundus]MAB08042.1 Zn-dependent hydrolase [Paracoccaceae bacterium]GGA05819.1 Zn-dependent hydrolase [Salipiger profundus]SFC34842.1 L-ascorbate metabolism protein UlaG, beta-lactamase superfamily [Salipiger profundus]
MPCPRPALTSLVPTSLALILALLLPVPPAAAQESRRPSHCIAIADATPGLQYLHKAAWTDPVPDYSVRIHYIAHASFMIQTRGGIEAVTDYNGFLGNADFIPDVVTMNHAHGTHWTGSPDPAIPHVLEGWGAFGEGIEHHLDLGEMLIRNVSTDIRSAYGGTEERGNSIFVFEVEGLCIGHVGHLHHEPNDAQYAALGRLDVVMVPVDGGYTMSLDAMLRVVERLKSSIIIPMHWFSGYSLEQFLGGLPEGFAVDRRSGPELVVSLRDLPPRPTVTVLQPAYLAD